MQPNAPDKTRSEDARAVLTAFAEGLAANGSAVDAQMVYNYRDTHYPPPKPEPVWRKGRDEYQWAIVAGELRWRSGYSLVDFTAPSITANLVCQLAADYYRQQGVTVPEEARRAYNAAYFNANFISDGQRAGLEAALPYLLAANQRKPKAVDWVVWDMRDRRIVYCPRDHKDALSWVRAFGNSGTSILALVEPEEMQP